MVIYMNYLCTKAFLHHIQQMTASIKEHIKIITHNLHWLHTCKVYYQNTTKHIFPVPSNKRLPKCNDCIAKHLQLVKLAIY